jgi:excinuclease ABC subunit A
LKKAIKIEGARTHNLKSVSCSFPARKISVVTGVSGSGKSSLVFDTLYAEGQRRYVQSLSTYARLFLEQMERPDVDRIGDIPPAIALEQKNAIKNARSTVGTITEIHDYLRLLLVHAGTLRCPDCGIEVTSDSPESATAALLESRDGVRAVFHSRVELHGVEIAEAVEAFARQGYTRLFAGGKAVAIDEVDQTALPTDALDVVIDRVSIDASKAERIREALEAGFERGAGRVCVDDVSGEAPTLAFDRRFACGKCDREFSQPTPHLFSFNSPLGACAACEGFGRVVDIDLGKVIPNKRLSLRDGAVAAWSTPAYAEFQRDFLAAAERNGYSTGLPYSQLPQEAKDWIYEGDRESPGIKGFFEWLENRRYKTHVRILLARYRSYRPCPDCRGARLKPEALAVRIGRRNIADFCALSIGDLSRAVARLPLDPLAKDKTKSVMVELKNRLQYLLDVGLGYLTLDRQARTLSGGEAQRIHLAAALGSALTDTLYALDEPTVGLHPRDSGRLLKVLKRLTKFGNTVVLVEHDPTLIEGADHVIDLGPGGGERGGEILYEGKASGLADSATATGRMLLIRTLHRQKKGDPEKAEQKIVIRGASENNLEIDELEIPLGKLVCVTGVSGSGKSTLVEKVLYENFLRERGMGGQEAGACEKIAGFGQIEDILMMTQTPIGRSLRSNPATYLKCYDEVRKLFAGTPSARRAKITPASFSFNTVGGRCERCQGTGAVTIEMHFMADIDVPCDECGGKRFKPQILQMLYKDKNIHDVLSMTVEDAAAFFCERAPLKAKLDCLCSVGLGYLRLGQSTSTLSGGEAQRLKLAAFLAEESRSRGSLFIFDEPTTGLHLQDVHTLIGVLDGLVARGHSVLVVEHHTDFISHADHIIDLGPEGGDGGGRVVVEGTPLVVAETDESHTGQELRALLGLQDDSEAV